MSWIVTQDYIKGRLSYLVKNTETGERVGEFADQLNSGDIRVSQVSNGHFGRKETA